MEKDNLQKLYSVIDVETTGGKYNEEGITEIAIYKFDGVKIVDQFISLVNPEKPIQPYVQNLTGITNNMVKRAPKFYEIAKRILEITENTVMVAHNVSFDHRMIKTEFERLGYEFNISQICTVNLSKKLIPGLGSYKLGELVKSVGIPITNRHRASGDAIATVELFKLLLNKDKSKEIVKYNIKSKAKIKQKFIQILENLPSECGVYYIHNEQNEIIYIGRSKSIRKRINQHLTGKSSKSIKIQIEISSVTYEISGNELISSLKETEEIRIHKPKLNKKEKKQIYKFGLQLCEDERSNKFLRISHYDQNLKFLEIYSSLKNAQNRLDFILSKYNIQNESCEENKKKIDDFLRTINFPHKKMIIVDKGRFVDEKSVILIENSNYVGHGYFNLNYQITNFEVLDSLINRTKPNKVYNKIIINYLNKKKVEKIVNVEYLK